MSKFIMALDAGTTSNRCILFNEDGEICSMAQKEFRQMFPNPGWVEHDANEIWSTQLGVAVEAMSKIGATAADIAAIGITNQRETAIVWNKETGEPVYNAIVWQCRRTADIADALKKKGLEDSYRKKTGLIIDAYFSATKIKWILDNVKGARKLAEEGKLLFGTVETWQIWKLTKGEAHVTDYSNASRTKADAVKLCIWLYRPGIFWKCDTDCRCSRRPAGSFVRTDLLFRRRSEEYIWYRLFPFDEYRRTSGIFRKWTGHHHCLGAGWQSKLCTGRLYLCGRCGNPVAA